MFSVIIPTYNRLNLLKRAVNSVLDQSFKGFEIIIVDDCSTDGTWEWLKSIKNEKIRIYRNKANSGESFSRNFAAKYSKFDFICFLDDDDAWLENHLYNFYRFFKTYPDVDMVFTGYIKEYPNKILKSRYSNLNCTNPILLDDFFKYNYGDVMMLPSCSVIKKEIFKKNKGFDPSIRFGEDIDLFTKIGIKNKVGFTNEWTVLYNLKNHYSQTNNKEKFHNADYSYLNKFKTYETSNPSLKRWLDRNRFSIARQLKLIYKNNEANDLLNDISPKNISAIKLYSLSFPNWLFRLINNVYFKYLK